MLFKSRTLALAATVGAMSLAAAPIAAAATHHQSPARTVHLGNSIDKSGARHVDRNSPDKTAGASVDKNRLDKSSPDRSVDVSGS